MGSPAPFKRRPNKRIAASRLHLPAQKGHAVIGRDPARIFKALQSDLISFDAQDRSIGAAAILFMNAGQLAQADALSDDRDQIAAHVDDSVVDFFHRFTLARLFEFLFDMSSMVCSISALT